MLGAFAEFETNLRRERQLEGIATADLSFLPFIFPPRRLAHPRPKRRAKRKKIIDGRYRRAAACGWPSTEQGVRIQANGQVQKCKWHLRASLPDCLARASSPANLAKRRLWTSKSRPKK